MASKEEEENNILGRGGGGGVGEAPNFAPCKQANHPDIQNIHVFWQEHMSLDPSTLLHDYVPQSNFTSSHVYLENRATTLTILSMGQCQLCLGFWCSGLLLYDCKKTDTVYL